jgi:hypothetical protein
MSKREIDLGDEIVIVDMGIHPWVEIPEDERLTSKCHPNSGMRASVKPRAHVLELRCAECGEFCEAFVISHRIQP